MSRKSLETEFKKNMSKLRHKKKAKDQGRKLQKMVKSKMPKTKTLKNAIVA